MNYFVIISTFVAKYFFHNQTNYMTFSYQLLPIWLLFTFSFIHKPNLFKLGVALCMLLEGVVYGARGPLIWLIAGAMAYIILEAVDKKAIRHLSLKTLIRFGVWLSIFAGIFFYCEKIIAYTQH